jgi:hypothetical protein
MVSFEIFVKAMPPSLSELKVLPSFCFAFKIPDDVAASKLDQQFLSLIAVSWPEHWFSSLAARRGSVSGGSLVLAGAAGTQTRWVARDENKCTRF